MDILLHRICCICCKTENSHQATLVWKRKMIHNQTKFALDLDSCIYTCLRGRAYVKGSSEYTFQFGNGAVGNVWKTKETQIVHVDSTTLELFFRRDLAKTHQFHTIILTWVDDDTILENAVGKRANELNLSLQTKK